MEKDKLENLIKHLDVPQPGKDAKKRAVKAAVAEFRRKKPLAKKKFKGFSFLNRLTGKTMKGDPVMRRSFAVYACIAVSILVVGGAVLPNLVTYRMSPSQNEATSHQIAAAPAQSRQLALEVDQAPAEAEKKRSVAVKEGVLRSAPVMMKRKERFNAGTAAMAMKGHEGWPGSSVSQDRIRKPLAEYTGRDRFEPSAPNPVKKAAAEPVSTFSVDVDTAAYAFVRRALNRGHLPQKHAVRIEEMINYFDYDYPLPADRSAPFKPSVTLFPTPWNPDTRLLRIGIRGFDLVPGKKPRSNLVFLIDVSGSMNSPDKLPLLLNAFRMLVETLEPADRVGIVVYAGAAGTVLESTPIEEKGKILSALARLTAGGATAGGAGIRQAYALAQAHFDPGGINRVILATDGDFNVGIRNSDELKGFVERKRNSGITLSVLGFGQGNYNDALMQKLAQNGNGNAAYIDSLNEARKVLVDEAASTLFTIAKDVKIQVEFNPSEVSEYRLIGYETRMLRQEDFNNDAVDAGDVGAGHSVTALYEIAPAGGKGDLIDDLRYGGSGRAAASRVGTASEYAFLKIRYKLPDSDKSRLITRPVTRTDAVSSIDRADGSARFAAAVAAFGQLLRGDPYMKIFTYKDVIALAHPARGKDRFGYRAEFLNLVRLAQTARTMGDR